MTGALAVDPPERDLMRGRSRDPRTGIFARSVVWLMIAGGVWSTIVNAGLIVYLPVLHAPFGTFSLSLVDCVPILALSFSVSPVLEAVKWIEWRIEVRGTTGDR